MLPFPTQQALKSIQEDLASIHMLGLGEAGSPSCLTTTMQFKETLPWKLVQTSAKCITCLRQDGEQF